MKVCFQNTILQGFLPLRLFVIYVDAASLVVYYDFMGLAFKWEIAPLMVEVGKECKVCFFSLSFF